MSSQLSSPVHLDWAQPHICGHLEAGWGLGLCRADLALIHSLSHPQGG